MKKVGILVLSLVACFALFRIGHTLSYDPKSNAIADSANTAGNIVTRDASGNFAANAITTLEPAGITIASNTTTAQYLQFNGAHTSVDIKTLIPGATNQVLLNVTSFSICVATGIKAGAWVFTSTGATGGLIPCYQVP